MGELQRYLINWNMQEAYPYKTGDWVKFDDAELIETDAAELRQCLTSALSREEIALSQLAALREELESAQEVSVANILMDVVPGYDGMGLEIYAKSVAEVQLLISNLYLKNEEQEQRLADAERRNAELTDMLRMAWGSDDISAENCRRIDAALSKPEEAKS